MPFLRNLRGLRGEAPGETPPTPKPDSGVAEMQQALKLYAQTMGYTPADPGEVTGIVDAKTAGAVISILPQIPGLPDEIKGAATLLPALLITNASDVYKLITKYAGYITTGILAINIHNVIDNSGATPNPPSGGRKSTYSVYAPWANAAAGNAALAPALVHVRGGAVPGNPTQAIWFHDWWTGMYRLAVPGGGGLGAVSYKGYIEVSPSMSKPATGTAVNRSTFMSAVGQPWKTTGGIIAIGAAMIGGGVGVYYGVRALSR